MDNPWMIAIPAPALLVLILAPIVLLIFAEQRRREVKRQDAHISALATRLLSAQLESYDAGFANGARHERGMLYKAATKAAREQRDILSALREAGTPVLN
jgi:hypothetical protein